MEGVLARRIIGLFLLIALFVGLLLFSLLVVGNLEEVGNDSRPAPTEQEKLGDGRESKHVKTETEHAQPGAGVKDGGLGGTGDSGHVDAGSDGAVDDVAETTTLTVELEAAVYEIHFNQNDDNSGKIYINYEGEEGFVCNDYFRDADADVICRQLGYKRGLSYRLLQSTPYTRYTTSTPILSGLNCTGSESHIHQCEGFWLGNVTECEGFAAAMCYNDTPYEFRLTNGITPNSGLVEIQIDGQWGMFCAMRNEDDDLADLVCRNMNLTGGLHLPRLELGPAPRTQVWVPYIDCTDGPRIKESIFECELVVHPDNVQFDYVSHWNNRYRNEFHSCSDGRVSNAATVQCFI